MYYIILYYIFGLYFCGIPNDMNFVVKVRVLYNTRLLYSTFDSFERQQETLIILYKFIILFLQDIPNKCVRKIKTENIGNIQHP